MYTYLKQNTMLCVHVYAHGYVHKWLNLHFCVDTRVLPVRSRTLAMKARRMCTYDIHMYKLYIATSVRQHATQHVWTIQHQVVTHHHHHQHSEERKSETLHRLNLYTSASILLAKYAYIWWACRPSPALSPDLRPRDSPSPFPHFSPLRSRKHASPSSLAC